MLVCAYWFGPKLFAVVGYQPLSLLTHQLSPLVAAM